IGAMLREDGGIMDVNPTMEAARAGLAPGMKILTVNGRSWSSDGLHEAIAGAKGTTTPITLIVENGSFTSEYKINYHGGERFPHLERDVSKPDLLSGVIKSRR